MRERFRVDPDPAVRSAVARALGTMKDRSIGLQLWTAPVRNLDWVTAHFGHR